MTMTRKHWRAAPFGLLGTLLLAATPASAQEPGIGAGPPSRGGPSLPAHGPVLPFGPSGRITRVDEGSERVEIVIGEEGGAGVFSGLSSRMKASPWGDPTGASLATVDETLRAQLQIPAGQGLVVTAIAPDSLAGRLGLQARDILLTFDGKPLAEVGDLAKSWKDSNGAAPLALIRAGKTLTLEVPAGREANAGPDGFWIGIPVSKVDEVLRSHLDLPEGTGLVITGVVPESPAARAGLKTSDILLTFDGKPVADAKSLRAQIRANGVKTIPLGLVRAGKRLTIEVTPEPHRAPVVRAEFKAEAGGGFDGSRLQFIGPGVVVRREKDAKGAQLWKLGGGDPADGRLEEIVARLRAIDKSLEELRNATRGGAVGVK